jgi:hypothetical protein
MSVWLLGSIKYVFKSPTSIASVLMYEQQDHSQKRWWRNGQVAAVSIILVSSSFLRSHAYLKDAAVLISGSNVTSPKHSRSSSSDDETIATKTAIQSALRQAQLTPEDIQILELRHGASSSAQAALGEMKVSEDSTASPVSHPFVGRTGLAGLCELGESNATEAIAITS